MPRITRRAITSPDKQATGIDNLLVKEIGADPRNGRIEYLILDTNTGESKVYAYQNKPLAIKYNQEILDLDLDFDTAYDGTYWAQNIRGRSQYEYISPEAEALAGVAMRCSECGQFSTVNHGCPMRSEPQVLTCDSTVSLWSNQIVEPVDRSLNRYSPIKVNLPPIREFRNALLTGAVKVEGIMVGGYRQSVQGNLTAYLDEEYALKINTAELICECETYTTNGTCPHIANVVKGVKIRLDPAVESLQGKTPAKKQQIIAKAVAKLTAEGATNKEKIFASDWTRKEATLEEAKKNWILESEVLYSQDFSVFEQDYLKAVEERKEKGEPIIAYAKENVLNGMATRASGQGFGVELELVFPRTMSHEDQKLARAKIGRELFEANLTSVPDQTGYHSAQRNGYKDTHVDANGLGNWSWETDGSVAGELVSPTMYDEPETWDKLEQAINILRKNGAIPSTNAGSHVHVGTGFYNGSPEKYTELARMFTQHEDVLFRLAADPVRGSHRMTSYASPTPAVPNNGYTDVRSASYAMGRRALNYGHVSGNRSDHPEFRIFDSSLNPGVVQAQIKLAVAMTHAAVRQAEQGGTKRSKEALGSHVNRVKAMGSETISLEEETTTLRSLLDTLFKRHEDKAQLVSVFANTKWSKGQDAPKRRRPRSSY